MVPAMWTYTWGVGTTSIYSASLYDSKKGSKPRKTCNFIKFLLIFLLTLSKLKFWQPRQLYQPCRPTAEVLGLLSSTLLHRLITKRTQNLEKRAFLLVNSNSDSHVNCTSYVDLYMRIWDKKIKRPPSGINVKQSVFDMSVLRVKDKLGIFFFFRKHNKQRRFLDSKSQ